MRLDGGAGATTGLYLGDGASGSAIRGLSLTGFTGNAIFVRTDNTTIAGNWIGVTPDGNVVGNSGNAVLYQALHTGRTGLNTFGGNAAADRNVLSGNGVGLLIDGFNGAQHATYHIEGNYIGVLADGMTAAGNSQGIIDFVTADVTIVDNVVSGNSVYGIQINGRVTSGEHADNILIDGNYVGVGVDGASAIANGTGIILEANRNVASGINDAVITNNLISGNTNHGIWIRGQANSFQINSNLIGTDLTETIAVANGTGISIVESNGVFTSGGMISGNTIANSVNDNVSLAGDGQNVALLGNRIYNSGELGIDLNDDGVTLNDGDDADAGSNGLQNFPSLADVVTSGSTFAVSGS
ncbi:MAG: hypothetical protein KDA55_20840, partial [Planctomycetales bacterium]|nr:hypothetical protein [Planctomycetales bacterium]